MPGFFVGGVFGFLAVGREGDGGLVVGGGEGEDVEDVGGDDVGGEEVDLVGSVEVVVGGEAAGVGVVAFVEGAFDLDAEEAGPSVAVRSLRAGSLVGGRILRTGVLGGGRGLGAGDEEVVGGAFSAGAGEDEAEFGGAELETEFGPLSATLGVADVLAGIFGQWAPWRRLKAPVWLRLRYA
jgi:hypothetical protein